MSLKVRGATVTDQGALTLELEDNGRSLVSTFDGFVTTAVSVAANGYASVTFYCVPRSAEEPAKPLNKPPVAF